MLYVTPSYVTVDVPHLNTVTVTDAVAVHPAVLVPVTVYVVVLVGLTVLELPVPRLCDQLYVLAPLADSTLL